MRELLRHANQEFEPPPENLLRLWVNSQYSTDDSVRDIRDLFVQNTQMVVLRDFLNADVAHDLSRSLKAFTGWVRLCFLRGTDKEEIRVNELEWDASPVERRFSRFDMLNPIPAYGRFGEFLSFLGSLQFTRWISKAVGQELTKMISPMVTRYRRGDYIGPHCDAHDRIARCNLYLDPHWAPAVGGNLVLKEVGGQETTVDINFNSLAITLVSYSSLHWVSEVRHEGPCRESLAFSYRS